jgi:hypothetical protein
MDAGMRDAIAVERVTPRQVKSESDGKRARL